MSQYFKESYFCLLPNEVLIQILSDIDTLSLLNFCEVYKCDYFLQDRNVIQTIDLYKKYPLEDLSFLSKKIVFEHVTTLNVNCLYWIPAAKLRKFVSRLINLETLYAIQTKLSLTSNDAEVYSNSKIRKLGVSMGGNEELGTHKILSVENLYISVVKMTILSGPLSLEMLFPRLRKLWIDVEEPCGKEIFLHCINGQNKTKIFCQVNAPIPPISFDHYWFTTYYSNRRICQPYVMCCEKFKAGQRRDNSEIEASLAEGWKVLNELHYRTPYGPRDARRLQLKENTLDDISFEEFNFNHCRAMCSHRCREAVKQILKSKNAARLEKVSLMMCYLQNENARAPVNIQDTGFTRKRMGVENSVNFHPAEDIFRNFLGLRHLEIDVCFEVPHHSAIQAYPLIALFENLQTLILEIPITLDGTFLTEVLKKCKRLERLKIRSSSLHEKLNFSMSAAIVHGTALRDFSFENSRIQFDNLLKRMCTIESPKLERIVLACDTTDKFSAEPLKKFLELNPQLTFLYFLLRECTNASVRMAQQTLNDFKKNHPSRVFLVKKVPISGPGYPIPDVHFYEMVRRGSNVASLHALQDFTSF